MRSQLLFPKHEPSIPNTEASTKRRVRVPNEPKPKPQCIPGPVLIDPATLPKVDTIVDKLQRQKEQEATV